MREIRFIDLFAGIGGFRLGLERANKAYGEFMGKESDGNGLFTRGDCTSNTGSREKMGQICNFHCVWSCEIDKHCQKVYAKNFGKEPEGGDIRLVRPEDIPEAELYTFGWPCQDNSIAGKRKGQAVDTRSGLLFEAIRIIGAKKPDYFIAENVPGLFSVSEGCDFYETIRMFSDAGYDCQWQALNTRWFLPQNRQRIYFVGHLRGKPRPEVFPIGEEFEVLTEKNATKQRRRQGISSSIDSRYGALRNAGETYILKSLLDTESQSQRIYDSKGIGVSISSRGGGLGAKTGLYLIDKVSQAIRATYGKAGNVGNANWRKRKYQFVGNVRRLTPVECERLQGFPDGWTEGVSDTQRYKMLGNAVSVPVVECIARKLLESLARSCRS